MSLDRTCARCATPLPDDAPEGSVCVDCAALLESEQTMATPLDGTPNVSYRLPLQGARAEVLGDFEIAEKLGQGGMGAVYRARQVSLDRVVALKVLPEYFAADEENVARFQREARIAAGLIHGNIVHVFSSGVVEGTHFIAMELVEGENLRQRMKRERLSISEALTICAEVARGLEYGWEKAHLVHRDIKPGNIFLSTDGAVKVGDLGLAKSVSGVTSGLTQTGTSLGTALYMSPEQVRGDKTFDFRSDIYSLGCTLYEMLTGLPPYSGSDGMAVMRMHLDAPLPAILKAMPGCPIPLARLVGKMLKKNARERHPSYADLIAELEMVREQIESGVTNTGPSKVVEAWKQVGDLETKPGASYGLLWAGLALLLVVGAGIAFFVLGKKDERSAAKATPAKATPAAAKLAAQDTPKPAAPSSTATSAQLPSAGATERWQDVLHDPAMLGGFSGAMERVPGGIRITGSCSVHIGGPENVGQFFKGQPSTAVKRDGAVRMRLAFGGIAPSLRLRTTPTGGIYQISVGADHATVTSYSNVSKQTTVLGNFPLPQTLRPGQEFSVEFRVVGQTLTARFNDQIIGTVTDATYAEGLFGIGVGSVDPGAAPTLITSLEFLDLDGLPEADALKLAGVSTAPAASDFRSLFDGRTFAGWTKFRSGDVPSDWTIADGAIFAGKRSEIVATEEFGDFELTLEWRAAEEGNGGIFYRVSSRGAAADHPEFQLCGPKGDGHWPAGSLYRLIRSTDSAAPAAGEWHRARLLVRGGKAEHWIDDRLACSYDLDAPTWSALAASSGFPAATQFATLPRRGSIVLQGMKDIAYRNIRICSLDGLPAADALKLVGISSTPAAATKDAPFVNSLGMKFVPVPITGGPTGGKRVLFSIWETRVQDYEVFAKATAHKWIKANFAQGPTHPAVNVNWPDANAFCTWLTEQERKTGQLAANQQYRLPSDHEWSCAAGIGEREDPTKSPADKNKKIAGVYPWGTSWPPPDNSGNYWSEELRPLQAAGKFNWSTGELTGYRDGFATTAPVASYAVNPLGLYDLGGNAGEWCEDLFDPAKPSRILRGSSWNGLSSDGLLSCYRLAYGPDLHVENMGFRVVLAPAE